MKRLISLLIVLGVVTSFTACSTLEDLAEDVQTANVSDGNNNGEDSLRTQDNQLNDKESLITATINDGDFTIIEELDKTTYEFHHPELENILYNKDGKVHIFYMLEGEGKGNYTTGNYYSDTTEIYVDYDEDDDEIWAFYEDENEESYFPDCIFENNTISLTFTEPNYKPAEYEFILVSIFTEADAFYYDGYFTDDVFEGENTENTSFNTSKLKHDVILTNGRDTIEVSFKEDGIHFDFTGENDLGNGYAIIPDANELLNEAVALYYKDDEILESTRKVFIEISDNGNLFTLQYEDSSSIIWEYTIKE